MQAGVALCGVTASTRHKNWFWCTKNKNQQTLWVKNDTQLFQVSEIASHLFYNLRVKKNKK